MANIITDPTNTSALKKRQFIFDLLFDKIEEEPMYIHSITTKGGHIKHHITYFTYENGYYVTDRQNTYLQKLIGDIMERTTEELDIDGKTVIVYRDTTTINNWFSKRNLTDLNNYVKLFKEELIQRGRTKEPSEFRKFSYYDRDENFVLLNTEDRTLKIDVKTNEIIELDFSPEFLFMSKITTRYEAEVNQKDWDFWSGFLEEIMPISGERRILKHWCAYALINKFFDWQVSIMLYGPLANNGKSTFMNAFGSLFNRLEKATLAEICGRFGTEKLFNADIIMADESSALFDDTSKLKQIFEGGSTNIEGKGISQYTGVIDAKVLIATNKLTTSLISDSGITRRVEVLSTPHSFSQDEDNNLEHELGKIKPTILYWAIEAIANMIKNVTNFKAGTRERTETKYRGNETPFNNFIAIYCDLEEINEEFLDELEVAYNKYRTKYQTQSLSAKSMGWIIKNDYKDEIFKKRSTKSRIQKDKATTKYIGISINHAKVDRDFGYEERRKLDNDW